jgi:hypothetical protein
LINRGLLDRKINDYGFEETWISDKYNNIEIDIHKKITIPVCYQINLEELWDRAVVSPFFIKKSIKIPCKEDLLIITAINCARDVTYFNHRLIDASLLINEKNIDREKLYKIADTWNILPLLFAQLTVLDLVGVNDSVSLIDKKSINKQRRLLIRQFVIDTTYSTSNRVTKRLRQLYSQWLLCESLYNALCYQGRYLISRVMKKVRT